MHTPSKYNPITQHTFCCSLYRIISHNFTFFPHFMWFVLLHNVSCFYIQCYGMHKIGVEIPREDANCNYGKMLADWFLP